MKSTLTFFITLVVVATASCSGVAAAQPHRALGRVPNNFSHGFGWLIKLFYPSGRGLQNAGKNCWFWSNFKAGPSQWCGLDGSGVCCRKGWNDHPSCAGGSIGGDGYHACVAAPTPAPTPGPVDCVAHYDMSTCNRGCRDPKLVVDVQPAFGGKSCSQTTPLATCKKGDGACDWSPVVSNGLRGPKVCPYRTSYWKHSASATSCYSCWDGGDDGRGYSPYYQVPCNPKGCHTSLPKCSDVGWPGASP